MLLLLLKVAKTYWLHLVVGAAALVLASLWYQPRLTAARAERDAATATMALQSDSIAALERAAAARRKAVDAALAAERDRAAAVEADNARLRDEITTRKYKDEPCEDAAAAVWEQWRSRSR